MNDRATLFNQTAILQTRDYIMSIIDSEKESLPEKSTSRIFLGGFSQGCFMSNSILVSYPGPDPLGGIICTSGLIALAPENFNNATAALNAQKNTPYLAYHGIMDPTVPIVFANQTYQYYFDSLYKDSPKTQFELKTEPNLVHTWSESEQNFITDWVDL